MRLARLCLLSLLSAAVGCPSSGRPDAGEAMDASVVVMRPQDSGRPDPDPDSPVEDAGVPTGEYCPATFTLAGGLGYAIDWLPAEGCTILITVLEEAVIEMRTSGGTVVTFRGEPGEELDGWGPAIVSAGEHELQLEGTGTERTLWIEEYGPPTPAIVEDHSLVWTDADLFGDHITLSRVMGAASDDAHGGTLLQQWLERFATTAHSERLGPLLLLEDIEAELGDDASLWDLDALPFTITGVHNRLDLISDDACGELRLSAASTHPIHEPFHLIFLFRQPPSFLDRSPAGTLHCQETARTWAALGQLEGAAFAEAADDLFVDVVRNENFIVAESVDFTIAPWEWRQWERVANDDPATMDVLPFVLDNPPLFQTVDIPAVNAPGPVRDLFVEFVEANAAALAARTALIPAAFRARSARVNDGVPWAPLDLSGVDEAVLASYPSLRQQIEIIGCPACHTADADFVQTREDRTFSKFYELELEARAAWLQSLAHGVPLPVAFGPLQADPAVHP